MMAGIAYYILVRILVNNDVSNNRLAKAIGRDKKGILSVIIYFIAIPLAFVHSYIVCSLYILVALIWLIPDNRIAKEIRK